MLQNESLLENTGLNEDKTHFFMGGLFNDYIY